MIQKLTRWLFLSIIICGLASACHHSASEITLSTSQSLSECRVIKHSLGETCVPLNPQRLITLSVSTLGNVLALGVKPIGTTNDWQNESNFLTSVGNRMDGVKNVGNSQPNLETILHLKPDLIVGVDWFAPIYPLLSKIAPTVLGELYYPTWEKHLSFVAEVLGKQEVEKAAWDRYLQRISQLRSALGSRYHSKTFSFIFVDGRGVGISTRNSFAGFILRDVGLQRPPLHNVDVPYGELRLSQEELDKVDADILFVGTFAKGGKQFLDKLQRNPLWQKLRAVQTTQVYYVDVTSWCATHMAATDAVIDDLYKYLVNSL